MELHIGKEIRRVLAEKGITPDWLAQKINTSRRNLYDILEREEIRTGQLQQICDALDYDFFSLYQKNSNVNEPIPVYQKKKKIKVEVELDGLQSTLEYWYETLKKINASI